jgi:hypothetical protein
MKVCLLGREGVVKEIVVFSRGNQPESPFNEKEQTETKQKAKSKKRQSNNETAK